MTLDIHTHAFHPKIADKAVNKLKEHYRMEAVGDGRADDLLARLKRAGLDRACVHAAATTPAQVIPANNWAVELNRRPELIAFGTIHPGFKDFAAEFDRLERAGVKGIKLHADFQGFRLDDPALWPIFEAIEGRFTVMFHVGDRFDPRHSPSSPVMVEAIHRDFPNLAIIAAHMGGLEQWELVLTHLAGKNVYLDTSSCLDFIPDELFRAIWDRHPLERICFGSDYPLYDPGQEMAHLLGRPQVTDKIMEKLLVNGEVLFA